MSKFKVKYQSLKNEEEKGTADDEQPVADDKNVHLAINEIKRILVINLGVLTVLLIIVFVLLFSNSFTRKYLLTRLTSFK
jgi:hypothetical protein